MSDSVRPHRQRPTRLPHPWDSPDKNTGVGCHFLLQCRKVKSESEVAQSCLTPNDPMDCSLPGFSIHGIFQARVLEWGAIALGGGKKLLLEIILRFGLPRSLRSINGTSFTSKVTQGVSKALGISYCLHCAWRPQASGKVERANEFLKSAIK